MPKAVHSTLSAALLAACLLLAACGAPQVRPSGFLSRHPELAPVPGLEGVTYWERAGVMWDRYKRLLVEPVQVRLDKTQSDQEMTAEETAKLAASLREAVIKATSDRYPPADKPGPDVLMVRAALTHLKPVNPALNVAATLLLMTPVDVGEAAVEVQFLDSQTGEVVAEAAAAHAGSAMALTQVWTRWSQVEAAFAVWADMLRQAMDEPAPAARR